MEREKDAVLSVFESKLNTGITPVGCIRLVILTSWGSLGQGWVYQGHCQHLRLWVVHRPASVHSVWCSVGDGAVRELELGYWKEMGPLIIENLDLWNYHTEKPRWRLSAVLAYNQSWWSLWKTWIVLKYVSILGCFDGHWITWRTQTGSHCHLFSLICCTSNILVWRRCLILSWSPNFTFSMEGLLQT